MVDSPHKSSRTTLAGHGILVEKWHPLEMQVANALVRRDALHTPMGRACKCCPPCWCKRMNVVCWYVVLSAGVIMGLALVIAFGVGIVAPYKHSAGFLSTTCNTVKTIYDPEHKIPCSCGSGKHSCSSYYPCLKIFVTYTRNDDEVVQSMLQASEFTGPCTYTPTCSSIEWTNRERVRNYRNDFGLVGLTYSCLYNPKQGSTEVIQTLYGSELRNVHLLVWPAAFTVLFAGLGLIVYNTCGCEYVCRRQPPEDVKNGADQLRNMGISDLDRTSSEEAERLLKQCCPEPTQL